MTYQLRDYQVRNAIECNSILKEHGIVYLMHSVRSGKTLTTLEICRLQEAKKVLFITKKLAFSSIKSDYENFGFKYDLTIINKESLNKILDNDFDIVIIDEAHQYGALPKPGKYQKEIRERFKDKKIILLSGTPTPENYSQIYHQLQLSNNSPFKEYTTFYKWANDYINVVEKWVTSYPTKDYTDANIDMIKDKIKHICHTFTQEEAGFKSTVTEHFIEVKMKPSTYNLINTLKKDKIIIGKQDVITADSGAKMMLKIHQIGSGTIKLDSGKSVTLDYSKALKIEELFYNKKIAIFYVFKQELELLKEFFKERITTDLSDFNSNQDKWIALQYVSGREGLNLSKADVLVMYNIPFSSTSYFQAKDRLTTKERTDNNVYWLIAKRTIDNYVYKAVSNKRNFTNTYFKREFNGKLPN